jgi:hypothetical protein
MGGVTEDMLKDGSAMTDRTLSPTAQAVLDAYNAGFIRPVAVHHKPRIAAALRAVVQELKYFGITEKNILAIAAELEGIHD